MAKTLPINNHNPTTKTPHVALLIETSRSYGRDMLRGVKRYVGEHGPWSLFVEPRALESQPPVWLKKWKGDGLLTRTGSQAVADAVAAAGVPTVELRTRKFHQGFPFLGVDNRALGRMVAEHLLERGFRRFGIYGLDAEEYFTQRCDNFVQTVRSAGFPCDVLRRPGHREKPADWERRQDELRSWLAGLEKPVGVMACTDQLGFWLLDACKRAGAAVPDDVAVVGVEDDETLCEMASPGLSSVRFPGVEIGYRAASLLDQMMQGHPPPAEPWLAPPLGITVRQSSDVTAVDDPLVAEAVRWIRAHACQGVGVEDVLQAVAVSRSSLERRMRTALGRSPAAEILRARLAAVRRLLADTSLSLTAVAYKTGFEHPQYLNTQFKRCLGETPGEYRARMQGGPRREPETLPETIEPDSRIL